MDVEELEARRVAKLEVRRVLRELGDEMEDAAYTIGLDDLKAIHLAFLDYYKALCGLVSCVASDDPELVSGGLLETAYAALEKWRGLMRDMDESDPDDEVECT